MTNDVFIRPSGKLYRPRTCKLRAQAWEDAHPLPGLAGVIVFGTLDPDTARRFAQESAAYWFGDAGTFDVSEPRPGWWRTGYERRGERAWIEDDERGAPGVMFTWAERVSPHAGAVSHRSDPLGIGWDGTGDHMPGGI